MRRPGAVPRAQAPVRQTYNKGIYPGPDYTVPVRPRRRPPRGHGRDRGDLGRAGAAFAAGGAAGREGRHQRAGDRSADDCAVRLGDDRDRRARDQSHRGGARGHAHGGLRRRDRRPRRRASSSITSTRRCCAWRRWTRRWRTARISRRKSSRSPPMSWPPFASSRRTDPSTRLSAGPRFPGASGRRPCLGTRCGRCTRVPPSSASSRSCCVSVGQRRRRRARRTAAIDGRHSAVPRR